METNDEHLHDIRDLHETTLQAEAKAYLGAGWRLLKVLAKRDGGEYEKYVLGWPSDQPPIRPKGDWGHHF